MRTRVRRLAGTAALVASLVLSSPAARASDNLDAGIRELTQQIAAQMQKLGRKRLAVVDFGSLDGRVTDLGRFVAEELSADLVLSGSDLRVLDRQNLSKIIQEQKLSVVGVTQPGAVQKLGQLAGADLLVAGTTVNLGDSVRITAKVLSTATADIVGAAQATVPIDDTVARMLGDGTPAAVPLTAKAPPGVGPSTPLADAHIASFVPDGYRFTYITKPVAVSGRQLGGGLLVFPANGRVQVVYDLAGQFDGFSAVIGVPDSTPPSMRAVFRVYADGTLVYPGRTFRAGDPPAALRVPLRGARAMTLEVEAQGIPDHGTGAATALWGEPTLAAH